MFAFDAAGEVYAAKNLDWFAGQGYLFVNKRGLRKESLRLGAGPTIEWISRYASLTLSQTGLEFPWDGVNEAGLSVSLLQLIPSRAPEDSRPALDQVQFVQYLLDTAANVPEALARAAKVRVGPPLLLHYFLCDKGGACAVLEYQNGKAAAYAGSELPQRALTNSPYPAAVSYFAAVEKFRAREEYLADLNKDSLARFARAAFWSNPAAPPASPAAYSFAALENLSQINKDWRTHWSLVLSHKAPAVAFKTRLFPSIKTLELASQNLDCRSGPRMLDLNQAGEGDLAESLRPFDLEANAALVEQDLHLTRPEKEAIKNYPGQFTRCE